MASVNDSFFKRAKSWSKRKHRLLSSYLKVFSVKVGSRAPVVFTVDGFAGAGKYEKDDSPGSPLLMAHLAESCAGLHRPIKLKIINVEANDQYFASLEAVTKKWAEKGVVNNIHGRFDEALPQIINDIADNPVFFFIDPFGPTAIPFAQLRPILARTRGKTELLINFDADGLRRMADRLSEYPNRASDIKSRQTTIARVTEILGSDVWIRRFSQEDLSTQQRQVILLEEYMANLAKFNFAVAAYPVRKSIKDRPEYYLIFCTRHEDGILAMNDFVRREEDELLRESTSTPEQNTLIDFVDYERQSRRAELKAYKVICP